MSWGKFKLLLQKNLTIQKRHPIGGIFEVFFPICLSIILAYVRDVIKPSTESEYRFHEFQPMEFKDCETNMSFAYSPANSLPIAKLLERFIPLDFAVHKLHNSKELNDFLLNQTDFTAGIEFDDHLAHETRLPNHLNYTIRLPHNFNYFNSLYPYVSLNRRMYDTSNETYSSYYLSCFMTIQNELERAFISKKSKNKKVPSTSLRRFPYPSVTYDDFLGMFAVHTFPFFIVIAFLYTTNKIIKNVAMERESQMKETMKIMGLSSLHHWLAWFIKCFLMISLPLIFMVVFLTTTFLTDSGNAVFMNSNPFLILVFLLIHAASLILFCFLISVVFKKSSTAANVGSLLYFFSYIPYASFNEQFDQLGYFTKLIYCMPLNSGTSQGIFQILMLELDGEGLQFSNLFTKALDIDFSFGEVLLVMIFVLMLHLLLMIYIDQAFPGEFGVPKKWYFPLQPLIRMCNKSKVDREDDYSSLNSEALNADDSSRDNFEEEPADARIGIQIANLTKYFGTKIAVNRISLNLFEDQITVLLGHNGAGKTTCMSMLTGMFPPSSGTAYIDGKDIRYSMDDARNSIGICPQHNILFDELTVEEHFRFFCRLKGVETEQRVNDEVNKYITMLEMDDKRETLSRALSGGMKRKLSIGIALCGNSKIVICDEPTSGMDSAGRRALWDLLIDEKKNRTILLTTHMMDEADVLGDRIAIMANGELKTVGSSFFLKKRFGTGYKLICEKANGCDAIAVKALLKRFVPDVKLSAESKAEVSFIISEESLPKFHGMFKAMEDNSVNLKISSFGCSLTTLEEVFIKIGSEAFSYTQHKNGLAIEDLATNADETVVDFDNFVPSEKVTGVTLWFYQVEAIILKKFFYLRRNYATIIWYGCLSALLIYLILAESNFEFDEVKSLNITFDAYRETVTTLELNYPRNRFLDSYKGLFSGKDTIVEIPSETMDDYILSIFNKSYSLVMEKYLIGATIEKVNAIAWFNGRFPHAMPLSLNTLNRAILKDMAGDECDIFVSTNPIDRREEKRRSEGHETRQFSSQFVFPVLFLFFSLSCYWPAIFVAFYIKERECRAKLLQFISGVNGIIYWVTSFLFDYTIYFIIIALLLAKVSVYQSPFFSTFEDLSRFVIIFGLYGFSMLPFLYLYSYMFSKHSTGESLVPVLCIACAILFGAGAATYKANYDDELVQDIIYVIYYIGLMLPPVCLLDIFRKIPNLLQTLNMIPDTNIYEFTKDAIGLNLLLLLLSGIFYLTICILKDLHVFGKLFAKLFVKEEKFPTTGNVDADVQAEIDRVNSMTDSEIVSSNLVVKNLSKFYGNFLAVNKLCLTVDRAECFGLLGINGAGKTTCFKMLTGDETITTGDAFTQGFSMKNQMNKVNKRIGYCPQFDALLLDLTGRETLIIFCLLRGIPKDDMEMIYTNLSSELGFWRHLDKQVKAYSGGSKRKLSTALALIGDPNLIFLDEPTSGIDPSARRKLWNVVAKSKAAGRSVVLTSHSMEECEALCSRLAIMVSGQFKCMGSTQHLKNRFSKGFILTVKAGHEAADSMDRMKIIKNEIKQLFPNTELKEEYLDILTYHIPDPDLKWSEVFGLMAQMKNVFDIDDYSLTQTTLEQVFLFFSKSGSYQHQTNGNAENPNHTNAA